MTMDPLMDSRLTSVDDDMNFTADISTQMRVPDRLSFAGGHTDGYPVLGVTGGAAGDDAVVGMQLPDKILVAGAERHIELSGGVADPFSNLLGDEPGVMSAQAPGVVPPPSVLRVDAARFPEMRPEDDDDADEFGRKGKKGPRRRVNEVAPSGTNQSDSDFFEDESLYQLQQQISKMQRRMDRLESEVVFFQQRDRVVLPIIGVYALYKIITFLFKRT